MLFVLCQVNYYTFLMFLSYLYRPLFFAVITSFYTATAIMTIVFYALCIAADTTDNTMIRGDNGTTILQRVQQRPSQRRYCADNCCKNDTSNTASYDEVDPENRKYCYLCSKFVAMKTHHCRSCEQCTFGFDHHCAWMNCCIGERNYVYFIGIVASLSAQLLISLIAIITIMYMVFNTTIDEIIADNGGISNWALPRNYMTRYTEYRLGELRIIIIVQLVVYVLFFLLMTYLFSFHIQLMILKTSTYQYLTGNGLAGSRPSITRSRSNAVTKREGFEGIFALGEEGKIERDGAPGFVSGPSPTRFDGETDIYGDIVRNLTPQ